LTITVIGGYRTNPHLGSRDVAAIFESASLKREQAVYLLDVSIRIRVKLDTGEVFAAFIAITSDIRLSTCITELPHGFLESFNYRL